MEILSSVPLAQYSSWKVGGRADFYCTPTTVDEVQEALRFAQDKNISHHILSGGTNVLISDHGVPGLTIHLRKLVGLTVTEVEAVTGRAGPRISLEAYAGVAKSELLKVFLKYRLAPAVFLAGLPGDVGGGVAMNAGVGEMIVPREFVEIVDWVDVIHGDHGKSGGSANLAKTWTVRRFQKNELKWSYRHCDGWQPGVILRIGMSWENQPDLTVMDRVKDANRARLKKQPLEWPSCGSVFVNPPGGFKSGQLIDQCGLRGFRIGGAEVSEKHANFIINREHATAQDIDAVIRHVQKTVREVHGIDLKTEVVYFGSW